MKDKNLRVDELEQVIKLLLQRLRQLNGNDVEINQDFYWHIDSRSRYNVNKDVKDLTIGSIADNIEEIRLLIKDDSVDVLYHDIDALANVLLAISYELEKKGVV